MNNRYNFKRLEDENVVSDLLYWLRNKNKLYIISFNFLPGVVYDIPS